MSIVEPMPELSLCLIIKNEEEVLGRGLDSIKDLADEIVIVDTGSNDRSMEIAKGYTDKVFTYKWIEDFGAARNYAASKASNNLIMKWDADFVITESNLNKLKQLKKSGFDNASLVTVTLNMEFAADGSPIKGTRYATLYRKDHFKWTGISHDKLEPVGELKDLSAKYYPEISIDNLKDKSKVYRYNQNMKNLLNELKENPKDVFALGHLIDSLLYQKKDKEALSYIDIFIENFKSGDTPYENYIGVIDKKIYLLQQEGRFEEAKSTAEKYSSLADYDKSFLLSIGDAYLPFDPEESKGFYLQYINSSFDPLNTHGYFNHERHFVHPYLMLAGIYKEEGDLKNAKVYGDKALAATKSMKTKDALVSILES